MKLRARASIEVWPIRGRFTVARGSRTEIAVVVATVEGKGLVGRGEGSPIYYEGESAKSVAAQIESWTGEADRDLLMHSFPPGAARNALDAAIWGWQAKAGLVTIPRSAPVETAFTISIDTPEAMAAAAQAATQRGHSLLKIKLGGTDDIEHVCAVRTGAPEARLIIDANGSWTGADVAARAAALLEYGVELIEQPVRAGEDAALDGVQSPIRLCADESVRTRADLARCAGRYDAVNIKLDKAGGLTEALALQETARAQGFKIMVGCMLSTSLGIAPAMIAAQRADWIDLDGPLLLDRDQIGGVQMRDGLLYPPDALLWGGR